MTEAKATRNANLKQLYSSDDSDDAETTKKYLSKLSHLNDAKRVTPPKQQHQSSFDYENIQLKKNYFDDDDDDDDEKNLVSKKKLSAGKKAKSRSPSTERSNYDTIKKKTLSQVGGGKVEHFSRPRNRDDSLSSRSDSQSSSEQIKLRKKSQQQQQQQQSKEITKKKNMKAASSGSSSDDDENEFMKSSLPGSNKKVNKKEEIGSLGRANSYSDSFVSDSKSNSSKSKINNRSTSSSSSSSENEKRSRRRRSSDSQRTLSAEAPIRVNIERKPPIDKSSWNKKKSKEFERPHESDPDENTETRKAATAVAASHRKQRRGGHLNETFDLDSSSNEMTDVSPLPTPKKQPSSTKERNHHFMRSKYDDDDDEDGGGGGGGGGGGDDDDCDRLDMNTFYKALSGDLNKRMDMVFNQIKYGVKPDPTKDHRRKKNPPSDADADHRYDRMNEKLIKKIIEKEHQNNKLVVDSSKPLRLTSSAINRQRDQQRIEKENQMLYKRLTQVKASKYLNKHEQMRDYEKMFGSGGLNVLKYAHLVSSTPNQLNSNQSFNATLNTPLSASSLSSAANLKSSSSSSSHHRNRLHQSFRSTANNSRLSSAANSRVSSAKTHYSTMMMNSSNLSGLNAKELLKQAAQSSRSRPEWSDRW